MHNPKKLKAALISASVVFTLGVSVLAASYDSSDDPLVSLSYLTNIFKPSIEEKYEKKIQELEARLSGLEGSGVSTNVPVSDTVPDETEPVIDTTVNTEPDNSSSENPTASAASGYEVVELSYGDVLYASSACDIMLRSGSAACVAPDASQGIADYTDGYEIYNDQALVKNHMVLIPRGDGRGIKAISESVFVMIRGEYTVVEG